MIEPSSRLTTRLRTLIQAIGVAFNANGGARLATQMGIHVSRKTFLDMVHNQKGEQLESWLDQIRKSHIPKLIRFGKGIERDKPSVQAALTIPYSNGVVEGHVHRLKLIKRQGYGRASFSLLRQRVLYQAV